MYFTGIVNSAYHWSRRFSLLLFNNFFFPFKLAFIYVLYFSFLCITVFEIKLFDAVKSISSLSTRQFEMFLPSEAQRS